MILCRDQDSRNSETELSETVQLEYSMTLVRMVNGISDKAQKGKTATSVSSNAAAAGSACTADHVDAVASVVPEVNFLVLCSY